MLYLIVSVHVLVCVFLILVVLLQQGKGADLSVFGGGSTQTAFGARGATTFLHKLTVFSFIVFVLTTLGIGILQSKNASVVPEGAAARQPAGSPVRTPGTPGTPGTKPPAPAAPARPGGGPAAATPAPASKAPAATPVPAPKVPPPAPKPGAPR